MKKEDYSANTQRIKSFGIDHLDLPTGIYNRGVDINILTIDIRMKEPYKDKVLSIKEIHSVEHMLAHTLRNGQQKEKVVFVGPMGCATGFYVLFRDIEFLQAVSLIRKAFYSSLNLVSMPGDKKEECGNNATLCLEAGKKALKEFMEKL